MNNLPPIYRLKTGYIEFTPNLKLDFIWGLVYCENGIYIIELHFYETFDLKAFHEENQDIFYTENRRLECHTDERYKFTALKIQMRNFSFDDFKGEFYCNDCIIIEKDLYTEPNSENAVVENLLKYIKLEGLRIQYSDHTCIKASRSNGEVIPEIITTKYWDHSVVIFQIDYQSYKFIIRNDQDGEALLEFQKPEYQFLSLPYNMWEEIKNDFIEFLSFFNGAPVYIRAEYYGQYFSVGKLDSQIKRFYSGQTYKPVRWNNYIPINNPWYRGNNLIKWAFLTCFKKYRELNKTIDLSTIIYYLNNAEQAHSMGERIFIQTILLERFSDKYAETFSCQTTTIIEKERFDIIQEDLIAVIEKNKNELGYYFGLIKSRLLNINKTKRKQTDFKFRKLIIDANIEITDDIESLLIARNKIVHLGDIGEGEEALQNYLLMDRLIRKIIVNFIGYKGPTIEFPKNK